MKPFVSFLLSAATLLPMFTAAQFDGFLVNGRPIDISGRFVRHELDQRLVDIHTNMQKHEFYDASHRSNVAAIRRHTRCGLTPSECRSAFAF